MRKILLFVSICVIQLSCRTSNPQSDVKVVGGTKPPSDNPVAYATIGLSANNSQGSLPFCSGTLVTKNKVITAAHCLKFDSDSDVPKVEGFIFFEDFKTGGAGAYLPVSDVAIQRDFRMVNRLKQQANVLGMFDIAIITFTGNLPDGYVPVPVMAKSKDITGLKVISGGHGKISDTSTAQLSKLFINLTVESVDDSNLKRGILTVKPEAGTSTCNGDSGGPLFYLNDTEWELVGVVSGGGSSCENNQTNVFASVDAHRSWLAEHLVTKLETGKKPLATRFADKDVVFDSLWDLCQSYEMSFNQWAAIHLFFSGDLKSSVTPEFNCRAIVSKTKSEAEDYIFETVVNNWKNSLGQVIFDVSWRTFEKFPVIEKILKNFPTRRWVSVMLDSSLTDIFRKYRIIEKIGSVSALSVSATYAAVDNIVDEFDPIALTSLSALGGRNPATNEYLELKVLSKSKLPNLKRLNLNGILLDDDFDFESIKTLEDFSSTKSGKDVGKNFTFDASELAKMNELQSLSITNAIILNPDKLSTLQNLKRIWFERTDLKNCDFLTNSTVQCVVIK